MLIGTATAKVSNNQQPTANDNDDNHIKWNSQATETLTSVVIVEAMVDMCQRGHSTEQQVCAGVRTH